MNAPGETEELGVIEAAKKASKAAGAIRAAGAHQGPGLRHET